MPPSITFSFVAYAVIEPVLMTMSAAGALHMCVAARAPSVSPQQSQLIMQVQVSKDPPSTVRAVNIPTAFLVRMCCPGCCFVTSK